MQIYSNRENLKKRERERKHSNVTIRRLDYVQQNLLVPRSIGIQSLMEFYFMHTDIHPNLININFCQFLTEFEADRYVICAEPSNLFIIFHL